MELLGRYSPNLLWNTFRRGAVRFQISASWNSNPAPEGTGRSPREFCVRYISNIRGDIKN